MKAPFVPFDRPRGQPLLVFAVVLGGWLVLRVLLWESPFAELAPAQAIGNSLGTRPSAVRRLPIIPAAAKPATTGQTEAQPVPRAHPLRAGVALPSLYVAATAPAGIAAALLQDNGDLDRAAPVEGVPSSGARRLAIDQQAVKAEVTGLRDHQSAELSAQRGSLVPRWSGDAWLLLREGSAAPLTAGRPAYGRSQAGAVLRYRLAPRSGHRPVLYVRATLALAGAREGEVAAGFAARPVPGLPVSVAAEARAYDGPAGREIRPAVFAVTELPPAELPFGLRGEAYVQAGYVGGTFATAFVDGQARADRQVAGLGQGAELRLGAAAWGGAQKRAERIDLGPSASASFRLGEANARLALDYRFRIAGNAEPRNGPALTFSAGF